MTPETIAAVQAVAQLISSFNDVPLVPMLMIFLFGPQLLMGLFLWEQGRRFKAYNDRQEERMQDIITDSAARFSSVVKMYEDNVILVKDYRDALKEQQKLSGDLAGIIHLNTQVQTQLVEKITNNMFCPLVREKGPSR